MKRHKREMRKAANTSRSNLTQAQVSLIRAEERRSAREARAALRLSCDMAYGPSCTVERSAALILTRSKPYGWKRWGAWSWFSGSNGQVVQVSMTPSVGEVVEVDGERFEVVSISGRDCRFVEHYDQDVTLRRLGGSCVGAT